MVKWKFLWSWGKKKKSLLERGAIDQQWNRDVEQIDIGFNLKIVLLERNKVQGSLNLPQFIILALKKS